jgi:hypothetical protein
MPRTKRRPAHGRLPTARDLVCTPELAILAVIERALDVANVALVAAQPDLRPNPDQRDDVATAAAEAADQVIACGQALAMAIADYRAALRDQHDDLLPF